MPSLEWLCFFGSRRLMWETLFCRNNQLDAQIRVNTFHPWASQRSVKECVMISAQFDWRGWRCEVREEHAGGLWMIWITLKGVFLSQSFPLLFSECLEAWWKCFWNLVVVGVENLNPHSKSARMCLCMCVRTNWRGHLRIKCMFLRSSILIKITFLLSLTFNPKYLKCVGNLRNYHYFYLWLIYYAFA